MRLALAAAVVLVSLTAALASATAATSPLDRLSVTMWEEGRPGPARTWSLQCRPAGGTHPARARACLRIGSLSQPFRPVSKDTICTQEYGGPQEALVTGTHRGKRIWARFNLRDGCQIARWERLVPLLPRSSS